MTEEPDNSRDISDYRARVRMLTGPAREEAAAAFDSMYTAFVLANGPCEKRSLAWAPRLLMRRMALSAILRRLEAGRTVFEDVAEEPPEVTDLD